MKKSEENCVIQTNVILGADKSLTRTGRKQTRKHVKDARDFNSIETRVSSSSFFLQGKEPKEISHHYEGRIRFFPFWSG